MSENLLQGNSGRRADFQAALDQITTMGRHSGSKGDVSVADLFVGLEGDVAAHHVIKQDPQAPDRGSGAVVTVESNPFGWSVHSRS